MDEEELRRQKQQSIEDDDWDEADVEDQRMYDHEQNKAMRDNLGGGHRECKYCNQKIFGSVEHICGAMMINTIQNENCLTTMSRMQDDFIDLTVTSPPYDEMREYDGYSFPFEDIVKELYRVTKQGGVVVWIVADATIAGSETGTSFKQALHFMQCGFNLHDTMIWNKPAVGACGSNLSYWQAFEYMFIFSKGKPKTVNRIADRMNASAGKKRVYAPNGFRGDRDGQVIKDMAVRTNVWDIGVGISDSGDSVEHPAPFPEKLAKEHIYSWSNEGDLVYDCFSGSGTTAKMAHLSKRNWIASEISEKYCDEANKRLAGHLSQTSLF